MRSLATVIMLACASGVNAQTTAGDIPVSRPRVMSQAPAKKPSIRKAAPPGVGNVKAANVPPGTPVVTLQGVCKDRQAKSPCETVITRQDLDLFISLYAPNTPETGRSHMAVQYARNVAFSALAEQQGLDRNPALVKELELQLRLVRMRVLANAFLESLPKPAASDVTEPEIQRYYEEHRAQYEQVQVRRLSVPFAVPTESGRPLDRATVKAEMEGARSRAVAGEDLNQLQQDAYKHLHIQATPPAVGVQTLRRISLQGDDLKAFDLKPGEISAVLDSPAAFAFVKLESKEAVPIGSVHQEIEAALRQKRMEDEVGELTKTIGAKFNLQYFGMPSQPDIFRLAATSPSASAGGVR